jgi:glycosyltransferase involved in cell wall biosynthesis
MGLKPEAFVTLLFGQLRPYKGVEGAIEAFRQDAAPDSVLIVAGKPSSPAYASAIRDAVGADPRIVLIPEFIGDETLSRLLAACDLVLLNHRKMNNSGVALMALSADRPILAPPIAAIRDLAKDVGLPWVNTFDGDLDAKSLSRTRASIASIGASDRPDLDRMAPDLVAEQIVHLYRY